MLDNTEAYKSAVVADSRRVHIRAVIDLSDPDMQWGSVTGSTLAPWSKPDQLHDKDMSTPPKYTTLEKNRWILGEKTKAFPADYSATGQIGIATEAISGPGGIFASPVFEIVNLENTSIIQAASFFFSGDPMDGVPEDFTIEIFHNETVYFTKEFTGNTERSVSIDGFTVYDPTSIKVTCNKMSLPSRRFRMVEVIVGLYGEWGGDMLSEFSVNNQGEFSCLTLPYGTANIAIDNVDRKFEPRRKDNLFQSIEERQGISLSIGVELPDGSVEYKPLGIYYQSANGWKTSQNSATIKWSLIDIIGLLCNRTFIVPDTLPTTLEGWMAAVVAQLGTNFTTAYHVDPDYKNKPVTAKDRKDVTDKKCGDIIRWACMASGTWPRAAAETGYLTAEPLWNQGSKITLEALTEYPLMKANESIAALTFQLSDGTEVVFSGNEIGADKTVTVQNPFIHTGEQAEIAARNILTCYGGNVIDITGRGDPSSEIGDVDTVWLDESNATTARRKSQSFDISNGVMQGCKATLLQADGLNIYDQYVVLTESGQWQAPAGVSSLFVVVGAGGGGGGHGKPGYAGMGWNNTFEAGWGDPGENGKGGKVWYGMVNINPQQIFQVSIGAGGIAGTTATEGENTTFGTLSSANGEVMPYGYSFVGAGLSFSRTGVAEPLPGTGNGGKGGDGGEPGAGYLYQNEGDIGYREKITKQPGPGKPGKNGASGYVLVAWAKPDSE